MVNLGWAALLLDHGSAADAAFIWTMMMLIWLPLIVLFIACFWSIFTKAGEPGWACLIPIYNAIVILKIAGKPAWWFLLYLIPLVNVVIAVIVKLEIAKRFGKGTGFAVGMIFLPFIFYPILAWGSARYTPPPVSLVAGGGI